MRTRKNISLKEKLAAALYEIARLQHYLHLEQRGYPKDLPPDPFWCEVVTARTERKPADAVIAMFHCDHNEFHAYGGQDAWWNLTVIPKAEHLEKTKTDLGIIAKGKRIQRKHERHKAAMAAKGSYADGGWDDETCRIYSETIKRFAKR